MLEIDVVLSEEYDEESQKFLTDKTTLSLEHSLVSISKWESIYEKPFLSDSKKTPEEMLGYIECMIYNQVKVNKSVLYKLSEQNLEQITTYINSKQTATWFSDSFKKTKNSSQVITSELIYYWMFSYQIPKECENWYLNRLLTLIQVFNANNSGDKKMDKQEQSRMYSELNAKRKKELNTKG